MQLHFTIACSAIKFLVNLKFRHCDLFSRLANSWFRAMNFITIGRQFFYIVKFHPTTCYSYSKSISTCIQNQVKTDGRISEAITLYERALAMSPSYGDAMYNLGVAYAESDQVDKAQFMYEMAIHFHPKCAEAHNNLGVVLKERDNLDRAVEYYKAALNIKPNFPQV